MVGSGQSTAGPNFALNTIVADVLKEVADELEGASDVNATAQKLLRRFAKQHARIIFNGDNYTQDWTAEAERRGLPNIRSSVDSLLTLAEEENMAVLERHCVLSRGELHARVELLLETYAKQINVEGRTALQIAKRQILPVATEHASALAAAVNAVKGAGLAAKTHAALLKRTCALTDAVEARIAGLEKALAAAAPVHDAVKRALAYRDTVVPALVAIREVVDQLEQIVDARLWPLPTYAEMLFIR
jgi:glutamine synthetase